MEKKQIEGGKHSRSRRGRKVFLVLGIIALLLLGAVIVYAIWERPPAIIAPTSSSRAGSKV